MHDSCNVLKWLHERFLFGFALSMPMTPYLLLNESLSASLLSYTLRVTPPPPSSLTWLVSLPSMLSWVFRLVSRDWNAPRFTFFDKDYVASLFQLEAPRRASIFPCSANFGTTWTCQMAVTWLSGQPSWLGSFPSSVHPTLFREVLGTLTEFYSSDTLMSSSRMREQSLKSDIRKQISSEIGKSVSPFFKFQETNFALCWPSLFQAVKVIPSLPTFSYAPFRWVHYIELLSGVKQMASISGADPQQFGCHSLHRGGATFAAGCSVPAFYIKLQGNWSSDCYTRYITLSLEAKLTAPSLMSKGIRSSCYLLGV
jgi:hypothetical protein